MSDPVKGRGYEALRSSFVEVARAHGLPVEGEAAAAVEAPPAPETLGEVLEAQLRARAGERRRRGSYYTPPGLVQRVVEPALRPLLPARPTSAQVLALRVCDPSMGAGAFVLEACRWLARELSGAWQREGQEGDERAARRRVAEECVRGIDLDALAVQAARWSLWVLVGDPTLPPGFADATLAHGDALLGESLLTRQRGGFDAFVGNPPWVSYVGRAAQPLPERLRAQYLARYASFRAYRNLQGLFVERCASLLRPGGRLGLVLPGSMAELSGYAPVRETHDQRCVCDDDLPDLGDEFADVFQPCMVLLSTRRESACDVTPSRWPLARTDLAAEDRALLARFEKPPLPAHLFGERGVQTSAEARSWLRPQPDERHCVALRAGADVRPFELGAPSFHAAPEVLGTRGQGAWSRVRVLIRQTARVPIAALSDGLAFRNSLLAGFEDAQHPAAFLVAYLNSTPLRWLHHARHRDARHGMPQLKIAHLRSLPAPPTGALVDELATLGARLSARNAGLQPDEQRAIDEAVGRAFGLSRGQLERLWSWHASVRPVPEGASPQPG